MPKQNRGPYILAAGAAAQLLTGIPAAWGVFQQPVMQGYGFSRGQAMLAFAVLVAAYGVGCAVGGLLQDARGPRFAGLWGTVLLAGGFFAAALVPPANAALFLVVYSVPAGLGSAFLAPAVLACAQKWYQDKKGWATGVAGVAMGLSGAFFTVFVRGVGGAWGIRVCFAALGAIDHHQQVQRLAVRCVAGQRRVQRQRSQLQLPDGGAFGVRDGQAVAHTDAAQRQPGADVRRKHSGVSQIVSPVQQCNHLLHCTGERVCPLAQCDAVRPQVVGDAHGLSLRLVPLCSGSCRFSADFAAQY